MCNNSKLASANPSWTSRKSFQKFQKQGIYLLVSGAYQLVESQNKNVCMSTCQQSLLYWLQCNYVMLSLPVCLQSDPIIHLSSPHSPQHSLTTQSHQILMKHSPLPGILSMKLNKDYITQSNYAILELQGPLGPSF